MKISIKTTVLLLQFFILFYFAWCVCCSVMTWYGACHNSVGDAHIRNFLFNSQFFKLYMNDNQQVIDLQTLNISKIAATIGFMGSVLHLTLISYIVSKSRALCTLFKQGYVFSFRHTALFKNISVAVFLMGSIAMMISEMCTGLALSFDQGIGKRIIQLGFGTPNLTVMFWSGIAYLVSHVMQHGSDLYDEQQLVI